MENNTEIILYQSEDGSSKIEVRMQDDTVWLTQAQMTELFHTTKQNISLHIKNIFSDGELDEDSVVKESLTTASDGKQYRNKFYNLDVIISVGYRVKSLQGTHFRKWALSILKEYLIKGFAIDDNKLKESAGGNYWQELLDRIRDIRSSEKVFYRQVLDLYATSVDYEPTAPESIHFFKIVQNKIHAAAHGHTAAEIIFARADAMKPYMGLTSFKGSRVTKKDIGTAKNYLSESELYKLNRLVSAFFDIAEIRTMNRKAMYMEDWINELDEFTKLYGDRVLTDAGILSHEQALEHANSEYAKYRHRIKNTITPVEQAFLDTVKEIQKDKM